MRALRAAAQLAELVRVSREGARVYGTGAVRIAANARRARRRQGYEYREALDEGLLDPGLSAAERALFGSRHATVELQRTLNSEAVAVLAGEKAAFYRYCAGLGIRIPALYGVIDAAASSWGAGRPIVGADDFARFVADDLPDEWVVKPSGGYHGLGVRLLRRSGDRLIDDTGRHLDAAELYGELRSHSEFGAWVVQERLRNHETIVGLVNVPTLQTVRIVTLVDRDGAVEVLYAVLRLAVSGGVSDNFVRGSTGNGLVDISVADGRLGSVKLARDDGYGFVRASRLPGSGVQVEGTSLPDWDATVALVRSAAEAFLPARTLGWDVALTPEGPVLVEANMFWWPRSGPDQGPVLDRLRRA